MNWSQSLRALFLYFLKTLTIELVLSALSHCVFLHQRQPHAHPCVLSPPLPNARIMSPFRESVGCQHVNISEMASIKYQALLRGCCWCAGRNAAWWREWQRERVIQRRGEGMMCFLPSRQICQVKDSTLLRRRICGVPECIKTCSSPFYVVFFLFLFYLVKVQVVLLCSSLN